MLRFKRDDGTSYPDWESKRITEVAETYIGLVTTMTAHYVPEGIPLIRNSDIKENRFVFKDPIYLDNEFAEKNRSRAHQIGDIITVHTGDVGTSAVINQELEGSIGFATIVTRIIDKEKNIPQFVCWYYNSPKNKKIVINLITGDGRNNLNMRDFNKLVIPFPCSEEQQKIADFLSEVDNIIAMSEQEIESLEMQKKGAMQKIFSQEVRFKADDGREYPEWEEKKIGNIFQVFKGAPLSKADITETGTPLILYGELYTTYKEVAKKIVRKTNKNVHRKYYSKIGDVVIPTSGETAEEISTATCVMCDNVILAGDLNIYRSNEVEGRYFSYLMNHCKKYDVARIAQGASVVHVQASEICKLNIFVPILEEQQKIADFLSEFDNAIEYAKEELEVWKNIKKGLLQQMFE